MNLQEQISRIQSMMGLIIETKENSYAPWVIIFDGENKILVGDMHQTPIELSENLEKKVISVANKYGYYGGITSAAVTISGQNATINTYIPAINPVKSSVYLHLRIAVQMDKDIRFGSVSAKIS